MDRPTSEVRTREEWSGDRGGASVARPSFTSPAGRLTSVEGSSPARSSDDAPVPAWCAVQWCTRCYLLASAPATVLQQLSDTRWCSAGRADVIVSGDVTGHQRYAKLCYRAGVGAGRFAGV